MHSDLPVLLDSEAMAQAARAFCVSDQRVLGVWPLPLPGPSPTFLPEAANSKNHPVQPSQLVHSQVGWNLPAPDPIWLTRTFVPSTKIALHFPLKKCNFVSITSSLMCGNRRETHFKFELYVVTNINLNTLHQRAVLFFQTALKPTMIFLLFQKPTVQSAMHYKFWAQNLIYIFLRIPKPPKIMIRDSSHIPRLVPQACCKLREKRLKVTDVWVA